MELIDHIHLFSLPHVLFKTATCCPCKHAVFAKQIGEIKMNRIKVSWSFMVWEP
jgi:hypothetical protein